MAVPSAVTSLTMAATASLSDTSSSTVQTVGGSRPQLGEGRLDLG